MADGDNNNNDPGTLDPESAAALKDILELAKKTTEERAKELKIKIEGLKVEKEAAEGANEKLRASFLSNEQRRLEVELGEKLLDIERKKVQTQAEGDKLGIKELVKLEKGLKLQKEAVRAVEAAGAQTRNMVKALTGVGDQWKETLVGGFTVAGISADGATDRMRQFTGALSDATNSMNIFGSMLQKVGQSMVLLAREQDEAIASFNKATSTMGEYSEQLVGIERDHIGLGISTQEAGAAFGALLTNVTTFRDAAPSLQTRLANTAARMQELGVSVQLTAQTMENAMLVLGMTEEQSMGLTSSLADMAIQMSLPIEQVTENFNAAMPVLAKFGKDAPDIFKKVQVASRSLGVEVGQLLQTMGQFDTFEGAAQAAGKLNTILGGDLLNSTELLMADEAERLRMVREAIALSGRQFDVMNRFEKLAVANALGVSDIATATKMLTGDMDRFGGALGASGLTKEETEERIRATQTIVEKLSHTFRMFTTSMRVPLEMFHSFINFIFRANEAMFGLLVPAILAVSGAFAVKKVKALKAVALSALEMTRNIATATTSMAAMNTQANITAGSLGRLTAAQTVASRAGGGRAGAEAAWTALTAAPSPRPTAPVSPLAPAAPATIGRSTAALAKFAKVLTPVVIATAGLGAGVAIVNQIGESFDSATAQALGLFAGLTAIGGIIAKVAALAKTMGIVAALAALGPVGWAIGGLGLGLAGAGAYSVFNSGPDDDLLGGPTAVVSPRRASPGPSPFDTDRPTSSGKIERVPRAASAAAIGGSATGRALAAQDRDLHVTLKVDERQFAKTTIAAIDRQKNVRSDFVAS